jgi:hypothetical protein
VSQGAFTRLAAGFALLAYGISVVVLWLATGRILLGFAFGLWSTFPVFWWLGWALPKPPRGVAHRRSAFIVGVVLAVAFAAFHLIAWHAAHLSSTGGFAYITFPFVLLIGTVVAIKIGNAFTQDA